MPAASVTPPGPILSASVTLTSAQVLAIFTTPVTIVPAPGAGLAIVPVFVAYNYTFGGTAYTDGGGNLQLQIGTIPAFGAFATVGFWDQAVSKITVQTTQRSVQNVSAWANKAMQVSQNTANPTGGNGTVTVTVAYMVVPVS